jgi:hypothetical protein
MLENIFGNKAFEKILFYILCNEQGYASTLARTFGQAVAPVQAALQRLERSGILVSSLTGKTRVYQFDPRYPFLPEFKAFIKKAYGSLPKEIKTKYYEAPERKRPRRKGKPFFLK